MATEPDATASKLAGVVGGSYEVVTLPSTGMADHIADPSDDATTLTAVAAILVVLENCGLIKTE